MPLVRAGLQRIASGLALIALSVQADPSGLDAAYQEWDRGDAAAAAVRLRDHIQEHPDDVPALLTLGRIYLDALEPRAAERVFVLARKAGAGDAETRIGLAEALLHMGRATDALEWAAPPAAATPGERADILALRAQTLLQLDRVDEATEAAKAAMDAASYAERPMLASAAVAASRGETDAARAQLEAAAQAHPRSPDAWQTLGRLAHLAGRLDEALAAYTKAIVAARTDWPLRYQRAKVYLDLQDATAAAADIAAVRRAREALPGLDYLDGRLSLLLNDPKAAAVQLETYLSGGFDDARARYFAALAHYRAGNLRQAEEHLLELIAAGPGRVAARLLLAEVRLAEGDAAGAEDAVRPLAEVDRPNRRAVALLHRALARQGRHTEVEQLLARTAERFSDDLTAQLIQARRLRASDEPAAALALIQRVLAAAPDDERAHLLLIETLVQQDDLVAALAAADAYVAQDPESATAHAARGGVLAKQGDISAARDALQRALALDPDSMRGALGMAGLDLLQGEADVARMRLEAIRSADPHHLIATLAGAALARREGGEDTFRTELAEALKQSPNALQLRLALAQSHLQSGDTERARAILSAAPPEQRQHASLRLLSAMTQLAAGETDSALSMLEGIARANPETPQYPYLLALVEVQLGNLDAAVTNLELGLARDRSQALTDALLSTVLDAHRSTQGRLELLERLLRAAPASPLLHVARARELAAIGELDEAIEILQDLAESEPGVGVHRLRLAMAMRKAGRVEEARALVSDWLKAHPDDLTLRLALARFAAQDGKPALAAAQYRRILELDASHAVALNNLAVLVAEEDPDAALDYAARALALEPNNSAFLDTKGVALLAKGDARGAVAPLARAHAGSTDPTIAFHYAKALAAAGDHAEARQLLLALEAQAFPEQADARALLDQIDQQR